MDVDAILNNGFVDRNPNYSKSTAKKGEQPYIKTSNPSGHESLGSLVTDVITPSSFNITGLGNLDNYRNQGVNVNPVNSKEELDLERADHQSNFAKLGNSIAQTLVSEIGAGTLLGISDLFDFVSGSVFRSDNDFSNPISQALTEFQENFKNDIAPIYRDESKNIFNGGMLDFGWWASNAPSIASSLTLLIPSTGVTKGLSWLGKSAKNAAEGTKLAKAAKYINEESALAKRFGSFGKKGLDVGKELGEIQAKKKLFNLTPTEKAIWGQRLETGVNAAVSRTMENYQEARGVYDDMYSAATQDLNNMSDEEYTRFINNNPEFADIADDKDSVAKEIARRSANRTFAEDYANIVFDVIELHALKNAFKGLKRNRNKTVGLSQANEAAANSFGKSEEQLAQELEKMTTGAKVASKAKKLGAKVFDVTKAEVAAEWSEGVEEAVNYIAQQEGMHYGNTLLGKDVDNNFDRRLEDYLKAPELWESAFWGFLGGVVFQAGGSQLNKLSNRILKHEDYSEEKTREAEINNRTNRWNEYLANLEKIEQGINPFEFTEDENGQQTYGELVNDTQKNAARKEAEDNLISSLALGAIEAGNRDYLISWLNNDQVKKTFVDQGIASREEIDAYVNDISQKIDTIADTYENYLSLLDNLDIEPVYAQMIARHNVEKDLTISRLQAAQDSTDKSISDIEQTIRDSGISIPENYRKHIDVQINLARLQYLRYQQEKYKKENTRSAKYAEQEIAKQIDTILNHLEENYMEDEIFSNIIRLGQKNKIVGINENKSFKFDNSEVQKELDAMIEKKASENPDVISGTIDLETSKQAVEVELKKQTTEAEKIAAKVATINQQLLDDATDYAFRAMQINSLKTDKYVTAKQIQDRYAFMKMQSKFAADEAVKQSERFIMSMLDKYDIDEVSSAIDTNDVTKITGIDEKDSRDLKEAIRVIDMAANNNQVISATAYETLVNNARFIKAHKSTAEVNGEPVDSAQPVTEEPQQETTTESEKAVDDADSSTGGRAEGTLQNEESNTDENVAPGTDTKEQEPKAPDYVPGVKQDVVNQAAAKVTEKFKNFRGNKLEMTDADFDTIASEVKSEFSSETNQADVDTGINNQINAFKHLIAAKIAAMNKRGKDSVASTVTSLAIEDIITDIKSTDEGISFDEAYNRAVKDFLEAYVKEAGIKEINGKYYITISNVLKYANAHSDNSTIASQIFKNLADYLATKPADVLSKFIITDENQLNKENYLNNIYKTPRQVLSERVVNLGSQRIDLDLENPNAIKAYDSLKVGDKLTYVHSMTDRGTEYFDVRLTNRTNISFNNKNIIINRNYISIGKIWIPRVGNNGEFLARNDDWNYDLIKNKGHIEGKIVDFLFNIIYSNDPKFVELNQTVLEYTFGVHDNAERNKLANKIKNLVTSINPSIIYGDAHPKSVAEHLAKLYRFVGVGTKEELSSSIEAWFENLYDSYDSTSRIDNEGTGTAYVDQINEGELLTSEPRQENGRTVWDKGPVQERIAKPSEAVIGVQITPDRNSTDRDQTIGKLAVSGVSGAVRYNGAHKFGNRYIAITNANGNMFFYNAFGTSVSSKHISQDAKDLITGVKEQIFNDIVKRYTETEDNFDELYNNLISIFGNGKAHSSLFYGMTIGLDRNMLTIRNGKQGITIFKSSNNSGKGLARITVDGKYKDLKFDSSNIDSTKETLRNYLNELVDPIDFNISENIIISDNVPNYVFNNSIVSRTSDGKLRIKVGNFDKTYDSYSRFLIDNNLIETTAVQKDGSNFGKPSDSQKGNPTLRIRIETKSSPVEESTHDTTTSTEETPITEVNASEEIQKVINDKNIKEKGEEIIDIIGRRIEQLGTSNVNKKLLKSLKSLGLSHKNIIFDAELKANAEYNANGDVIKIGPKFLELAQNNSSDAIRVLVHENLHRAFRNHSRVRELTKQLGDIYDEFVSFVGSDKFDDAIKKTKIYKETVDAQINELKDLGVSEDKARERAEKDVLERLRKYYSQYIFNSNGLEKVYKNKQQRIEEFLVESITQEQVADLLNNIDSVEAEEPTSLFKKIINFLRDLFGFNVRQGSLLNREINTLLEVMKDVDNGEKSRNRTQRRINTETAQVEEVKTETPEPAPTFTSQVNENGVELIDEEDEFNPYEDDLTDFDLDLDEYEYEDDDISDSTLTSYDNSHSNIPNFISTFPVSQQAKLSQMIARGELSTICR